MSAKRIACGDLLDYTPAADKAAGAVVTAGKIVGYVPSDVASGRLGNLAVEGVVQFPKATGSSTAINVGAHVYYKASDGTASKTASDGLPLGVAVPAALGDPTTAAGDSDSTVRVKLFETAPLRAAVVAALGQTISGTYSQSEVQAISTKVDAILSALKTAGLMASS